MSANDRERKLFGVLVTFRRPDELAIALQAIASQTRQLDGFIVVDNAPTRESHAVVREFAPGAEYRAASENLGPAGGIALGMERLLETADDRDWIVTLDDDDPPLDPTLFETLFAFACELAHRDPALAAVGIEGVRFDRRRGRMVWVPDDELHGVVLVDSIGGQNFPCYAASAIRAVGAMRKDLFFGFEELEFGLRLRDAGFTLYAPGLSWYARRAAKGKLAQPLVPSRSLGALTWRRYYSLRNLVNILREFGATEGAVRVTLMVGIGKPLANMGREPALALRHLRMGARACLDAWTGRMGRTVEPKL